jgi:branched-chain amino acid transport system permease protein
MWLVGGLLSLIGAMLPWATFVLNNGPYPEKSTLEFFITPFGVTGFRMYLAVAGLAIVVVAVVRGVPARGRVLRPLGVSAVVISALNGLYISVLGGGLGAITGSDGSYAFGALVALVGGVVTVLASTGAVGSEVGPGRQRRAGRARQPGHHWRPSGAIELLVLVVVFALLLLLVSAILTSGGQGGTVDGYAAPVFLSLLVAVAGLFAALHACGLLGWVESVAQRHHLFSVLVLLLCGLLLPLTGAGTEYWLTVASNIGVSAATAIGLNIVVGLAGLLDLGYVAFLGIGAFVAANLSGAGAGKLGLTLPFPLVLVIAAVVAGAFGAVVGSPTLRVRGDYLAIVTLAFGEIFSRTAQNNIGGLTGGANAIPGIPPVEVLGFSFEAPLALGPLHLAPGVLYYLLIVLIVAAAMAAFGNLKNSRLGRAWIAIREDEDAARAMGIETGRIKILAFLIGAMIAGFAGAFFAHKTATVSFESFTFLDSVTLLAAVILGGMGTVSGAVLGASILFVLPEKLREFSDYRLLLFGIALILIMRLRPQGLLADSHRRAEFAAATESETVPMRPVEPSPSAPADPPVARAGNR